MMDWRSMMKRITLMSEELSLDSHGGTDTGALTRHRLCEALPKIMH
jgi:hypothetical protein